MRESGVSWAKVTDPGQCRFETFGQDVHCEKPCLPLDSATKVLKRLDDQHKEAVDIEVE